MTDKKRYISIAAKMAGTVVCAAVLVTTLSGTRSGTDERSMQSLEDAVRRAAVSCYAAEGSYPDRLDYLVERYGLQLDPRYAVHYDIFASNLAPDVTVVTIPSEEEMWGK